MCHMVSQSGTCKKLFSAYGCNLVDDYILWKSSQLQVNTSAHIKLVSFETVYRINVQAINSGFLETGCLKAVTVLLHCTSIKTGNHLQIFTKCWPLSLAVIHCAISILLQVVLFQRSSDVYGSHWPACTLYVLLAAMHAACLAHVCAMNWPYVRHVSNTCYAMDSPYVCHVSNTFFNLSEMDATSCS